MSQVTAFTFPCQGASLVAILHPAAAGAAPARIGVLVVVGGPQYRVGSGRQFVDLARALAAAGVPVMRFDYRGMGDSDGDKADFEAIDQDIRAAIDSFMARAPGLDGVVLWGLCDAASAVLFYAHLDPRVRGAVILNPWVRTAATAAKAYLKHYYVERLKSPAFWRGLATGKTAIGPAIRSWFGMARQAASGAATAGGSDGLASCRAAGSLPDRMAAGLRDYRGPVLLVLSGDDLTAREFEEAARGSALWQRLLADRRVTTHRLPDADHTFSSTAWRRQVSDATRDWLANAVQD
ncbi:MAG: hydrolase 1, exosortase A system-associated [Alphaproteobacteria bacterium]